MADRPTILPREPHGHRIKFIPEHASQPSTELSSPPRSTGHRSASVLLDTPVMLRSVGVQVEYAGVGHQRGPLAGESRRGASRSTARGPRLSHLVVRHSMGKAETTAGMLLLVESSVGANTYTCVPGTASSAGTRARATFV